MTKFGTKAETLDALSPILESATILPLSLFSVDEWRSEPSLVLNKIRGLGWFSLSLIVRSSARGEDSLNRSLAGKYKSIGNVTGETAFQKAVEEVIASYGKCLPNDQVLVQPMLTGVRASGVAFSRDINTGAPYIIINYDDTTGATDSVTSGHSNANKTFYYCKQSKKKAPKELQPIVDLVLETEKKLGTDAVDIEFAVTKLNELYLLQARPVAVLLPASDVSLHTKQLEEIQKKIEFWNCRHPYLYGERTVFGVMPDWNPAEIVGVRPHPLALSLYREVITDNIWAYQRNNYGYMNLRSFPLIIDFEGLPYVDVRLSFNSFIPGALKPELAEKLSNYYLKRLVSSPSSHDRVEFDIVFSCYTPDLEERLKKLKEEGFTSEECSQIAQSLRVLTNRIINSESGLWKQDIEKISKLEERRQSILSSNLDLVSKVYWLLEDCKRYGTLPFAGLARAAFIAVQMLKSFVSVGALSQKEYHSFLGSLNTISSQMGGDFKILSKEAFLRKYGHLRPGTYDIRSPRYDEAPDLYFDWTHSGKSEERKSEPFTLSLERLRQIESLLGKHLLEHNVLSIFDFFKGAIEGRESTKFIFSRSLSDALSFFKQLGKQYGFDAEDCSFANIECIQQIYGTSRDPKEIISRSIQEGKKATNQSKQIILPPLITQAEDVWSFFWPECDPNYITMRKTTGPVLTFPLDANKTRDIAGHIVFIPSADPGYDWIFSHKILGFVTMYGGANSHMAIRAAEQGVPAIIGIGASLYAEWSKATYAEVDCEQRQFKVLR